MTELERVVLELEEILGERVEGDCPELLRSLLELGIGVVPNLFAILPNASVSYRECRGPPLPSRS